MVVPCVDEQIWSKLPEKDRAEDKHLQNLGHLLLQGQFALQPVLEYFLKKEGDEEDKLMERVQQTAKTSSFAHKKLVAKRRNQIRLHLDEKYKSMAKKDLPVTAHIFGEDLDKKVNALDKTKDIMEKNRGNLRG